jgi:hypothetical protein
MHDLELFMITNAIQVRQKLNNGSDPISISRYAARALFSHPSYARPAKAEQCLWSGQGGNTGWLLGN